MQTFNPSTWGRGISMICGESGLQWDLVLNTNGRTVFRSKKGQCSHHHYTDEAMWRKQRDQGGGFSILAILQPLPKWGSAWESNKEIFRWKTQHCVWKTKYKCISLLIKNQFNLERELKECQSHQIPKRNLHTDSLWSVTLKMKKSRSGPTWQPETDATAYSPPWR